jgi:hypothetical protein
LDSKRVGLLAGRDDKPEEAATITLGRVWPHYITPASIPTPPNALSRLSRPGAALSWLVGLGLGYRLRFDPVSDSPVQTLPIPPQHCRYLSHHLIKWDTVACRRDRNIGPGE